MNKLDLQLFSEAVKGKKIIYLFRPLSAAATSAGTALAFTTENGRSKSNSQPFIEQQFIEGDIIKK